MIGIAALDIGRHAGTVAALWCLALRIAAVGAAGRVGNRATFARVTALLPVRAAFEFGVRSAAVGIRIVDAHPIRSADFAGIGALLVGQAACIAASPAGVASLTVGTAARLLTAMVVVADMIVAGGRDIANPAKRRGVAICGHAADFVDVGQASVVIGAAVAFERGVAAAAEIVAAGPAGTELIGGTAFHTRLGDSTVGGAAFAIWSQTADLRQPWAATLLAHTLTGIVATGVVATFGIARTDRNVVVTTVGTTAGIALRHPRWADAFGAVPLLHSGAPDWFGGGGWPAGGIGITLQLGTTDRRAAAETKQALEY